MPNVCERDLPNPFDISYWWSLKRRKTCILKGFSILILHWHGGWVLPQVSCQPQQNCSKVASNFVMPNLAKSGLKVIITSERFLLQNRINDWPFEAKLQPWMNEQNGSKNSSLALLDLWLAFDLTAGWMIWCPAALHKHSSGENQLTCMLFWKTCANLPQVLQSS